MPKCIYRIVELNQNVPADDDSASDEHIIPWAIGGSNGLVTREASRKANNNLGSDVDAAFANTLPIAIMRHKLRIQSQNGNIPPIIWKGTSDDGHGGTMAISPDGTVDVQIDYGVQRPPSRQTGPITVSGTRERLEPILKGMLNGMKKRNEVAYSSEGNLIQSLDDFWDASEQRLIDHLRFRVQYFHQDVWTRGILKIVLAACHKLFGPGWTFSPEADLLRQMVNNPRTGWPAPGTVRGYVAGEWDRNFRVALGKTARVRDDFLHTVAVLPGKQNGQAVALVSLFGGNGVPETAVSIGKLSDSMINLLNSEQWSSAVMGYRINPGSRVVTPITFADVDKRVRTQGPTNKKTISLHHQKV